MAIRHRTEKEGGKSKGFAFLEFEGYDRMKTCLKLYQGSNFDDGTTPARRLNVELTWVILNQCVRAKSDVKAGRVVVEQKVGTGRASSKSRTHG